MATAETGTIAAAFERWTDPVINFSDFVWGGTWNGVEIIPFPPMVIILLGGGLWMMFGLRGYPITQLIPSFRKLFKKSEKGGAGEISPFAALSTALSGQVGHPTLR